MNMDQTALSDAEAQRLADARTTRVGPPLPIEATAYGPDGKLTRDGMVAIIRNGGSVMLNGHICWDEKQLPSEAQLAVGDAKREAAARAALQQQMAALNAQMALLDNSPTEHISQKEVLSTSTPELPQGVARGALGYGDTVGMLGDPFDENSPAGIARKEALAEADQRAKADAAQTQADAEALKSQQAALAKLQKEAADAEAKAKEKAQADAEAQAKADAKAGK